MLNLELYFHLQTLNFYYKLQCTTLHTYYKLTLLQNLKYTINIDRSPAYIKAWVGGLTTTCNNIEYYIHTCQNIIDTNTLKFAWRHTLGITHILAQLQLLLESDVIVVVMCGFCIKRMRMCIRDVTKKKLLKKHLTYYTLSNIGLGVHKHLDD